MLTGWGQYHSWTAGGRLSTEALPDAEGGHRPGRGRSRAGAEARHRWAGRVREERRVGVGRGADGVGYRQGKRIKTCPGYQRVGKVVKTASLFPAFLQLLRRDRGFRGGAPRLERVLAVAFLQGAALYARRKTRKSGPQKNTAVSIPHRG